MTQENKHIKQPADRDALIWRYMDFAKFVDVLVRKSLYFQRVDLQPKDPFEGLIPRPTAEQWEPWFQQFPRLKAEYETLTKRNRQWAFINCWLMSCHELAWPWETYTKSPHAVAIQTTYRKLWGCLPDRISCGVVEYGEHETSLINPNQLFSPLFFKDLAFADEKEIRAMILDFPTDKQDEQCLDLAEPTINGQHVEVTNLNDLIERVILAPKAESWFKELVSSTVRIFGIQSAIQCSRLDPKIPS